MMKTLRMGVGVGLILLLLPSMSWAQGRGRRVFWSGLALSAGGGVLSLVGGYGMRREECRIITVGRESFLSCINTPHTGMIITGGTLAAAGSVLMIVGANTSIAVGPRSAMFVTRF